MGKFLCCYTWPLLYDLATCVSWIMATVSHIVLWLCINSFYLCWLTWTFSQFLCHNACRTKSSFNLHSFYKSMENILKFSSGNWPISLHQFLSHSDDKYLLSNLTICFWTLNCTFVQVAVVVVIIVVVVVIIIMHS